MPEKKSEVLTGIRGNAAWGVPLWRDGKHLVVIGLLYGPLGNEKIQIGSPAFCLIEEGTEAMRPERARWFHRLIMANTVAITAMRPITGQSPRV